MDLEEFKEKVCNNCTKKAQGQCDGKIIYNMNGEPTCVEDDDE